MMSQVTEQSVRFQTALASIKLIYVSVHSDVAVGDVAVIGVQTCALPIVVELAEKYFGDFAAGPAVSSQSVAMVSLLSTRYISYEDQVRFPKIGRASCREKEVRNDESSY